MSTNRLAELHKISHLQQQVATSIAAFRRNQDVAIMTNVARLQDEIIAILIGLLIMDSGELRLIEAQNLLNQRALAIQPAPNLREATHSPGSISVGVGR